MKFKTVLAVETSCDDTSAAVVGADGTVHSCVQASQDLHHARFGGIVPEIASRNHTHHLIPLIEEALQRAGVDASSVDGLAVTARPGLIGALLTGLVTVKTLSLSLGKPFIGVNHLEGHLMAPFLRDAEYQPPAGFGFPYVALAVSGGHTTLYRVEAFGRYSVLGRTLDDAAGEAFDKFGKRAGLGFPGGVRVDRLARVGNPKRFEFPRAMIRDERDDMSFSGLKAAAGRAIDELFPTDREQMMAEAAQFLAEGSKNPRPGLLADFCASFQEAVTDVLVQRLTRAAVREGVRSVVLTGGVAANSRLRERVSAWAMQNGMIAAIPPLRFCTDNAAMIGFAGITRLGRGERSDQTLKPEPRAPLDREPQ
ncbi:MAG: tRNA (adenosine(37)-N6)-threonylcarbamoyltransferase complex transferase subunit TsaD [Bdellovibrionaceae bacterium]|nr:tRNA (adenosine(37)-N6)-threonylcarbamoyltransferase complex transferase subunit TsaD [Pseudobdellovibrionaceae bacterium]